MANETVKLDWNHPWQKIVGPYFVVGTKVMRHWPDSRPGTICDGEKQYGPDFVDTYSTAKAARKDADTMNKVYAEKANTL